MPSPEERLFGGVLFCVFILLILRDISALVFVVPIVIPIGYLDIRLIKFCDVRGATLYSHNWLNEMRFCSRCGARLRPGDGQQG